MELVINSRKHGTKIVKYDEKDHELISGLKWYVDKSDDDVYYAKAKNKGSSGTIRMHRLIMDATDGDQVDHIDHDGLNNVRSNLRVATQQQNSGNMRLAKDSTTGFKGVTYVKKKELYFTRIRVNGKLISGGRSKNIYAAAIKYNEMAKIYFGEFACLNQLTEEQIRLAQIKQPRKRITKSNSTGFRGVCISKNTTDNIYTATILLNGKNKYLGSFNTAIKAAIAYNEAVIKHNKPIEWLNEIQ